MEKKLTVLVPIHGDESFVEQRTSMPTISDTVFNVIYNYNGVYYRRYGDTIVDVVDVEFPEIGHPLELFDFVYSSTRMSTAATITASTRWFSKKDTTDNLYYNLDNRWTQECHVIFSGQNYYIKEIPSSEKDNNDARFKYDIEFVSHWKCLERVHIYDTVTPYIAERPLSENGIFSFFGDVKEMRKRINSALVRSGLSSYRMRSGVTSVITYAQWNDIPLGLYEDTSEYYQTYQGDYTAYLQEEVYVYENGEFVIDGYQVVIDEGVESEEKFISFSNNYIYDALQKISDKESGYGLPYYYRHGTKEIHIGECEYDFGEDKSISYGRYRELLSIKKSNTTERVINNMTGIGSSENIPDYYPNPTADGWLKSVYNSTVDGITIPTLSDAQPSDVYPSAMANAYEKFLKNRLGYKFEYGHIVDHLFEIGYTDIISHVEIAGEQYAGGVYAENRIVAHYHFETGCVMFPDPVIQIVRGEQFHAGVDVQYVNPHLGIVQGVTAKKSNGQDMRVRLLLRDVTTDVVIGEYDSQNYNVQTASPFEKMCHGEDGVVSVQLTTAHRYDLSIYVYPDEVPLSERENYCGYYYPGKYTAPHTESGTTFQGAQSGENFYLKKNLKDYVTYKPYSAGLSMAIDAGYSLDGTADTRQEPLPRKLNRIYKDLTTGQLYKCYDEDFSRPASGDGLHHDAFTASDVRMQIDEWIEKYLSLEIKIYEVDGWYLDGKKVSLADYGMTLDGTPNNMDSITFQRLKYLMPQEFLMPELYTKTDGERRYYKAVNYPYQGSVADYPAGESIDGTLVHNSLYLDENESYYHFKNPYTPIQVSENIKEYPDIKPSIKGMTNTVDGQTFRIDVAQDYDYDMFDDDSVWESEKDGNIEGQYKHPHFFIKLRQMPFNLFDMALQNDMEISLTSGQCGSCSFKVKVDERTKKNPVQVWEHDVYRKELADTGNSKYRYILFAKEGDLKRYTNEDLYQRGEEHIAQDVSYYDYIKIDTNFAATYTANAITSGQVGSLNTENYSHIEGDVVTSGPFQDRQQDTSEGEVWLALEKDTNTFGMLMPAARPTYSDESFSVYIRPKSVNDTHDENTADTFVITNIRMPQYYLRYAEKSLSKSIIKDMCDENAQKFNFTIGFSRIFLAENADFLQNLTENAVLYVEYNNRKYKQYVKDYTYKAISSEPLPEITVNMDEELSVVYGGFSEKLQKKVRDSLVTRVTDMTVSKLDRTMQKKYINKSGIAVISGDVISRKNDVSMTESMVQGNNNTIRLEVSSHNTEINTVGVDNKLGQKADTTSVVNDLSIIRQTIEYRFSSDASCGPGSSEKVIDNGITTEIYWLRPDGTVLVHSDYTCATDPWIYGRNNNQ